jgi:hypothetical protein
VSERPRKHDRADRTSSFVVSDAHITATRMFLDGHLRHDGNAHACADHAENAAELAAFETICGWSRARSQAATAVSRKQWPSRKSRSPTASADRRRDKRYTERPKMVSGEVGSHDHRSDSDYYSQPGKLFRLMPADAKQRLIHSIVGNLGQTPKRTEELQVKHFYKAEPAYGEGVAKGLGLDVRALVGEKFVAAD